MRVVNEAILIIILSVAACLQIKLIFSLRAQAAWILGEVDKAIPVVVQAVTTDRARALFWVTRCAAIQIIRVVRATVTVIVLPISALGRLLRINLINVS